RRAVEFLESIGSPTVVTSRLNLALLHARRRDFAGLEKCLHGIETSGRVVAGSSWAGQLVVSRLPILAFRRDWAGWRRTIREAAALFAKSPGVPTDVGTMAHIAGEIAQTAGEEERAREAYSLADEQRNHEADTTGFIIVDGMLSRLPKVS
ncbi:MAG: hypothetical protein VX498_14305, partial [Myxococcota bacterium]|nr:hypothetical protein [Myxococcota bacterium]